MDPALVGAVFAGITGVLTVVTGYLLNRRKIETAHVASDVTTLNTELDALRTRLDAALAHIYALREDMARHGHTPPDMPDELAYHRRSRRGA